MRLQLLILSLGSSILGFGQNPVRETSPSSFTNLMQRVILGKNLSVPRLSSNPGLRPSLLNGGVDTLGSVVYSIADSAMYLYVGGDNWIKIGKTIAYTGANGIQQVDNAFRLGGALQEPTQILLNGNTLTLNSLTYFNGLGGYKFFGDASVLQIIGNQPEGNSSAIYLSDLSNVSQHFKMSYSTGGAMFSTLTSTHNATMNLQPQVVNLFYSNSSTGVSKGLDLSPTGFGILVQDNVHSVGLAYNADYSLNGLLHQSDLWIPHWGFVKKSISDSVQNAKGITGLTGDVLAGPGAGVITANLSIVNSNVGSFRDANITVDGKGRITAASSGGNLNAGSGYRWVIPSSQQIKTVGNSGTILWDSTVDQLTARVNTSVIATQTDLMGKWDLLGNAGTNPATNFMGTTDNIPFVLRTNGIERARISEGGNVGIGTTILDAMLHVNGTGKFNDTLVITTMGNADSSHRAASTALVKRLLAAFSLPSPTLQQVLNAGSGLTSNNTITSGAGQSLTIFGTGGAGMSSGDSYVRIGNGGIRISHAEGKDIVIANNIVKAPILVTTNNGSGIQYSTNYFNTPAEFEPQKLTDVQAVRKLITDSLLTVWKLAGNAGTNPANHFLGTIDNQPMVFRTNNTEKMRITATGGLAIGLSSPTAGVRLHVSGTGSNVSTGLYTVKVEDAGASMLLNSSFTLGNLSGGIQEYSTFAVPTAADQRLGVIFFGTRTASNAGIAAEISSHSSSAFTLPTNTPAYLNFRTNNGSGLQERMRILANGNVGIGVTTPTALLHVGGTGLFSGALNAPTTLLTDNSTHVATTAWVKGQNYLIGNFANADLSLTDHRTHSLNNKTFKIAQLTGPIGVVQLISPLGYQLQTAEISSGRSFEFMMDPTTGSNGYILRSSNGSQQSNIKLEPGQISFQGNGGSDIMRLSTHGLVQILDSLQLHHLPAGLATDPVVVVDPISKTIRTRIQPGSTLTTIADVNYTVTTTDYTVMYTTATVSRTITMPAAASNANRILIIVNNSGNTPGTNDLNLSVAVKFAPTSSTTVIPAGQRFMLQSDGVDWWVVMHK